MNAFSFYLPVPPSVNHYWRSTKFGKHYVSEEGKKYRIMVHALSAKQGAWKHKGTPFNSITVILYPPDKRRRDLDNILKALLDSLQAVSLLEDDFQLNEIIVRRGAETPKGCIHVTLASVASTPSILDGNLFSSITE